MKEVEAAACDADVIVLGAGLAGSIAALCLVRKGLRVLVVDRSTHPRFALGESTTTPASLWLRVMAERFDVPELLNLASAEALAKNVAPTSGIKSNFGFLYHEHGAEQPARAWQAVSPPAYLSDSEHGQQSAQNEMHYFREDVDAWLWRTALAAGAVGREGTEVTAVEFDDEAATVRTANGDTLTARFVIDASGYRSPVAQSLGLRDLPPRMRSNTRTMFTHMVGVAPFEDTKTVPDSMAPWSHGTLHHFFDGGWVWVIPFDNHHAASNRRCSVGLNLDNRRFPKQEGVSAEQEWQDLLQKFPAIEKQFANAESVQPWVQTDRVQYSSSSCVGDRYWLTAHAAGAVDALFSMGNINTFQTLANGLDVVLQMFADGDFRKQRLQPVQELTDALLKFQDCIVYGNYVATRGPWLLQTWIALWSLTDTARIRSVLLPLVRYVRTGDAKALDPCFGDPQGMLTGIGMHTSIKDTNAVLRDLEHWCDIMKELEEGHATTQATFDRLGEAVRSKPEYGIDLWGMQAAFAKLPWALGPLAKNGLRAYGQCFLTPDELGNLGMEEETTD
jgi:FADH2 O2-dependent halogenase